MFVCLFVHRATPLEPKEMTTRKGTDRSAIYRGVFVYKKEFSPATIPGTSGQKTETASQLSLQNHHIFAITIETQ